MAYCARKIKRSSIHFDYYITILSTRQNASQQVQLVCVFVTKCIRLEQQGRLLYARTALSICARAITPLLERLNRADSLAKIDDWLQVAVA